MKTQPFLKFLDNKKNIPWIALAASLLLGICLWMQSDAPPYAHPLAEFNNNWWGPLSSMAHKWRIMTLDFWDLGIAGGCSLYLMGRYPIFNVFNAAAWFLDNNWLLLFMFIAPYMVGFFFMLMLLMDIFGLTLLYAVFGGLMYLGMFFSIHTPLLEQPIFLFGNFLFPAIVYVYLKTKEQSSYRKVIFIGSMIALQFAMAGIIQFFQVLIWWLLFLLVDFIVSLKKNWIKGVKKWAGASALLVVMAFTVSGVQFIPTLYYALTGAGRTPTETYYTINNFTLTEFGSLAVKVFLSMGILSGRIIAAFIFVAISLVVLNRKKLDSLPHKSFLVRGWLTVILYFLLPTLAQIITTIIPQLSFVFSPLRTFTFKYGLHILDFFIMLTLCLIFSNQNIKVTFQKTTAGFLLCCVAVWLGAPVFSSVPSVKTLVVIGIGMVLCAYLIWRPKNKVAGIIFTIALLSLGYVRTLTSFHHQEKGRRMDVSKFYLTSPDMQFYQAAKKKFLLPDYYSISGLASFNYNLVYGVHGTMGSETLSPIRFNRFAALFNNQENTHLLAPGYLYIEGATSALTTYFPVDFTTVEKNKTLPWPDFTKKISGEVFDIYERKGETKQIEFASSVECLGINEIVEQLRNNPFNGHIAVREEDCAQFNISTTQLVGRASAKYLNYDRSRGDDVQFTVQSAKDTFVMLKDMFQLGWEGRVDGKALHLFPAHYLFMGFELPAGEHQVELKFTPPLLYLGFWINVFSLAVLVGAIRRGRA